MANEITYMNPREFVDSGCLHEINRLLLHPLGLALQLGHPTEDAFIAKIWDYRGDREGIYFGEETLDASKAEAVASALLDRRAARLEALGYVVQPVSSRLERPVLNITYFDPE